MRRYYIIFFSLLLISCSKQSESLQPNTPVGNFEALWQIVDEKYCYFDEKNIDWDAIHDQYLPQIEALDAKDERALFRVLASMLDSLRDGHVNLYSDFDVSHTTSWYDSLPVNYSSTLISNYLSDYQTAGGLYYTRIANDRIGYIRYSSFESSFTARNMWYMLDYFADCQGLIVDVRSNGGGNNDYAYKLASTFFENSETVGYWQHKTGKGHNDFSELQPIEVDASLMQCKWLRPVAVLINSRCYSATNSFANAMRYAPYATLVGGQTGGGGGLPMSYELPNGWLIRLSSVPMYDRDKRSIEGGIQPNVAVNLTVAMTAQGKDDLIEKAIEILLSKK